MLFSPIKLFVLVVQSIVSLTRLLVVKLLTILESHPVSILYKSIAGRYRPVRVADGPITARYIFIMNMLVGYNI